MVCTVHTRSNIERELYLSGPRFPGIVELKGRFDGLEGSFKVRLKILMGKDYPYLSDC